MYQIIFFDIDGTLRDESYGIPDTAKTAIKMCKEKGYYICLCTGRNIGAIYDDVLELKMNGTIASGGAYIEFENEVIREKFFQENKVEEVLFYLKGINKQTAFIFETNDIVFMNKEAVKILKCLNEKKVKLLTSEEKKYVRDNEKIIYEDNMHKFNSNIHKVNKICLWSNEEIFERISDIFSAEKIGLAQCFKFDTRNYYEIIQKDCSKGDGIIEMCKYLNIPIKNTMAFGDGRNDIDMLKKAGTAIGMRCGSKEIFKYVDSICEEPINHGIYLELKRRNII
ncbi:Cof-type HAD-IIB family hydrolase [Clostridium sp. DJ247]|uniref:Cof-type HAD-IIB family hydrolase n=1 Tax=Clostridium sp. DJ247 TaxID=2726188 RepID=UPI001626426B|nr:Cof-type HAD-IIB family hydrolase [Clostridium sp. DJ247]MBC2579492.1 Cof-type HAD-IIB family hydrolase [Clostridium sp. DJ247]